jgi:hypothetical protein
MNANFGIMHLSGNVKKKDRKANVRLATIITLILNSLQTSREVTDIV